MKLVLNFVLQLSSFVRTGSEFISDAHLGLSYLKIQRMFLPLPPPPPPPSDQLANLLFHRLINSPITAVFRSALSDKK